MKTFVKIALGLLLFTCMAACDKDDDTTGTLIVNIRDNIKVSSLSIYTEAGTLIYSNTEYLYMNDPRLSITLNPGTYQLSATSLKKCTFMILAGHTTTVYYAYDSETAEVTYE